MKLLELEFFAFAPEGCPVFDYAVSLSQRGNIYFGAVENLTEGRLVQTQYITSSWSDGLDWFRNATRTKV